MWSECKVDIMNFLVCWFVFVLQASEALGPIDILINCAGFAVCGLFEETSIEDFKVEFETKVYHQIVVWDVIIKNRRKALFDSCYYETISDTPLYAHKNLHHHWMSLWNSKLRLIWCLMVSHNISFFQFEDLKMLKPAMVCWISAYN